MNVNLDYETVYICVDMNWIKMDAKIIYDYYDII